MGSTSACTVKLGKLFPLSKTYISPNGKKQKWKPQKTIKIETPADACSDDDDDDGTCEVSWVSRKFKKKLKKKEKVLVRVYNSKKKQRQGETCKLNVYLSKNKGQRAHPHGT